MKVERPPVTPAARCERVRSEPGLSLQLGSQHNVGALVSEHDSGLGLALPCEAGHAGPTFRQTDTLGVSPLTHSQEEAATSSEASKD